MEVILPAIGQFLQDPHGAASQKAAFFKMAAATAGNATPDSCVVQLKDEMLWS
jgi:hypothetical protein